MSKVATSPVKVTVPEDEKLSDVIEEAAEQAAAAQKTAADKAATEQAPTETVAEKTLAEQATADKAAADQADAEKATARQLQGCECELGRVDGEPAKDQLLSMSKESTELTAHATQRGDNVDELASELARISPRLESEQVSCKVPEDAHTPAHGQAGVALASTATSVIGQKSAHAEKVADATLDRVNREHAKDQLLPMSEEITELTARATQHGDHMDNLASEFAALSPGLVVEQSSCKVADDAHTPAHGQTGETLASTAPSPTGQESAHEEKISDATCTRQSESFHAARQREGAECALDSADPEYSKVCTTTAYLPQFVKGAPVLVESAGGSFLVDNSALNSVGSGLQYRRSADMGDRFPSYIAPYGSTVHGRLTDGWLKVQLEIDFCPDDM